MMFCNITFPERRFAYVPSSLVVIKRDDVTRAAARFRERFSLLSRSETIANYDLPPFPKFTAVHEHGRGREIRRTSSGITGITLISVSRPCIDRYPLLAECDFGYSSALSRFVTPDDGLPHYKRIFFSLFPSSPSFALPSSLFNRFPSELTQNHNNGHSAGARQADSVPSFRETMGRYLVFCDAFRAREDTRDLIHILE